CCLLPVGLGMYLFLGVNATPAPNAAQIGSSPFAIDQGMHAVDQFPLGNQGFPLPFVIIGRNGAPNRQVANLEDAIATAASGDVTEVQASGTFSPPPIVIKNKALTIRAAPGFTPGFKFTSGENTDTPMLQTDRSLVLEGLDFKRVVQRNINITVGP